MTKPPQYRPSERGGLEWSNDNGASWHLTFRTRPEVVEMWGDSAFAEHDAIANDEDREREIWGETLDDEIPDDLWAMLA